MTSTGCFRLRFLHGNLSLVAEVRVLAGGGETLKVERSGSRKPGEEQTFSSE